MMGNADISDDVIRKLLRSAAAEYVEIMNRHFSSKLGYFSDQDLLKIHDKAKEEAVEQIKASTAIVRKEDIERKLKRIYLKYIERNVLVFRSFQEHEPAVGIDFGTTYCRIAIYINGKVKMVKNVQGTSIFIPSYIRIDEDGQSTFSRNAKEEASGNPKTTIFDIKRIIAADPKENKVSFWPFDIDVDDCGVYKINVNGRKYSPEVICAKLFGHLKREAENGIGFRLNKAVVTVPGHFTKDQSKIIRNAAEMAGLSVLSIISEPIAATIAYTLDSCYCAIEKTILVYDLGGGNFNVALVRLKNDDINVLSVDGDSYGGDDFDDNVAVYCAEHFKKQTGIDLLARIKSATKEERDAARQAWRRLHAKCGDAKRRLTTTYSTTIFITALMENHNLDVEVTRKKFEEINLHLFLRSISIVNQAVQSAKLEMSDIDEILLVGDSTGIPKLQTMLQDCFDGKSFCKNIDPGRIVAYGAAIRAAILSANSDKKMNFTVGG